MNRRISFICAAICCLAVAITISAQSGGGTSDKIQQLEQAMHKAEMQGDASWYQQHLADGYVEGHSWGDWATRDETIKQSQDKSIQFTKGDISDVKVATFGPTTAVARYRFAYDATSSGTHRARTVICSDTWVNQSGTWKIISSHCSHVEGT